MNNDNKLNYADSGVDIDAGNTLVENIKLHIHKTRRSEVLTSIGGFSGAFRVPTTYRKPVMMAAADGVGTKLRLAIDHECYDGIGIDLVAMCVNDLVVSGAEPLYFLDYYATGKLDVHIAERVVASIAQGCIQAGCALIGGETAEMPGMYAQKDFDLAGFAVGMAEEDAIIDGMMVEPGDSIIALSSSGVHANGYSLVRAILQREPASKERIEQLLQPTKIYVRSILALAKQVSVKAVCHITGGGIIENLPRVLPQHVRADLNHWEFPEIFQWLQKAGNIDEQEMLRVFNCGIGMIIVVDEEQVQMALDVLRFLGEDAKVIGAIHKRDGADNNHIRILS